MTAKQYLILSLMNVIPSDQFVIFSIKYTLYTSQYPIKCLQISITAQPNSKNPEKKSNYDIEEEKSRKYAHNA